MLPIDKKVREMIYLEMQENAPRMYVRLKKEGTLEAEVNQRVNLAKESYLAAVGQESKEAVTARQKLPPLEQIAERKMEQATAAQVALAQATEFPSENGMDSPVRIVTRCELGNISPAEALNRPEFVGGSLS